LPIIARQDLLALYKDTEIKLDPNFREAPLMQSFFNQGGPGEIRFRDSSKSAYSGGPPRPAAQMKEFIKGYYADITYLDAQVGRLIEQLKTNGLYENTYFLYLADNGYHLGNHGLGNKVTMHEESVRVPGFIHSPLLSTKRARSEALVSSLDIYPTLLDLAGTAAPPQLMGKSLRPILADPAATIRDHVVSECVAPPEQGLGTGHRMVRTDRYKYMLSDIDEEAFFDLQVDPYELANRVADATLRAELERHRRLLRDWSTAVGEKRVKGTASPNAGSGKNK
jgi:arylsulfatase A-like enzyme